MMMVICNYTHSSLEIDARSECSLHYNVSHTYCIQSLPNQVRQTNIYEFSEVK